MADLAKKGWGILLPVTEHEPFDLVAYQTTAFFELR